MSGSTTCNCVVKIAEGARQHLIDSGTPKKEVGSVHMKIHSYAEFEFKKLNKKTKVEMFHRYCPCCGIEINRGA